MQKEIAKLYIIECALTFHSDTTKITWLEEIQVLWYGIMIYNVNADYI